MSYLFKNKNYRYIYYNLISFPLKPEYNSLDKEEWISFSDYLLARVWARMTDYITFYNILLNY